jgi:hypothetical protein
MIDFVSVVAKWTGSWIKFVNILDVSDHEIELLVLELTCLFHGCSLPGHQDQNTTTVKSEKVFRGVEIQFFLLNSTRRSSTMSKFPSCIRGDNSCI